MDCLVSHAGFAAEWAGAGVRVNGVAPGLVETDMTSHFKGPSVQTGSEQNAVATHCRRRRRCRNGELFERQGCGIRNRPCRAGYRRPGHGVGSPNG